MHAAEAGEARERQVLGRPEGAAEGGGAAPQEGPEHGRGALNGELREDLRAGDEPRGHPVAGPRGLSGLEEVRNVGMICHIRQ